MDIDLELQCAQEEIVLNRGLDVNNNETNRENAFENEEEKSGNGVVLSNNASSKSVVGSSMPPRIGLEFENKEEAYSFYMEYARMVGFGITIKASRRSKKSGNFIDIKIACSRFGTSRPSSYRLCPKTDCKASMHIKRRVDGKWFVYGFVEEHNHETCKEEFYGSLRGGKRQNGYGLCEKKGLQLVLSERDAGVLLDFLMRMQAEAPGFYNVVDFGNEGRMRNVFWADPKGRYDYAFFSDVVLFDTYYVRSKYGIPFVPVFGVNHHFQLILLGCALIGDDTPSTFAWLMRTWVRAVGGGSPKVVITDRGKSLIEAASEVFPDAFHCFCPWDVYREIGVNLRPKLSDFDAFLGEFEECAYRSWTIQEFEMRWQKMINQFDLVEDRWIQSLYEDRWIWSLSYMKDVVLGGFCTAERSQSVVSSFDKYLQKETTIEEFVSQYNLFLHERCEEEAKAETETQHTLPTLISQSTFEKQTFNVYTHALYKKFQSEVAGIAACDVRKEEEDEGIITYMVDDLEKKQRFSVVLNNRNHDICCLCHLFEYNGFLCRHALSILQLSGISTIPPKYILKRWTRKAKMRDSSLGPSTGLNLRVQRLNDYCKLAVQLSEEGSSSREAYEVASDALREALKHCIGVNKCVNSVVETNKNTTQGLSVTKQVPRKRKVQAEAETISVGIRDSSQDVLNRRSLCLDSCIWEPDFQGMDSGSRTTAINGHYGAQQNGRGFGYLHSLSLPQYCYYSAQPSFAGVSGPFCFRGTTSGGCLVAQDSLQNESSKE